MTCVYAHIGQYYRLTHDVICSLREEYIVQVSKEAEQKHQGSVTKHLIYDSLYGHSYTILVRATVSLKFPLQSDAFSKSGMMITGIQG